MQGYIIAAVTASVSSYLARITNIYVPSHETIKMSEAFTPQYLKTAVAVSVTQTDFALSLLLTPCSWLLAHTTLQISLVQALSNTPLLIAVNTNPTRSSGSTIFLHTAL